MIGPLIKLGEICTLHYGKSLSNYRDSDPEANPVQVFGTNGPIGWTRDGLTSDPTIVVGRKGAYRGVHFAKNPSWTIDTAYYVSLNRHDLDLKWLYYRLLLLDINRMDTGAAIPSTKREDFYAATIAVPPVEQQQRIASILSAYDDLIENNRRRIAILEEAAQQLYKEWFVRFRFPGHEHVKIIDGVPEGWVSTALSEIAVVKKGKNITKATVVEGNVPVVAGGLTPAYFHNTANVKTAAVTVSASGANAGFVNFYQQDIWASDCSYLAHADNAQLQYLYLLLRHRQTDLTAMQKGAAQPHVYPKDIDRLVVLKAPAKLVGQVADLIAPLFGQVSNLERQNTELAKARDILLPKLMNGSLSV